MAIQLYPATLQDNFNRGSYTRTLGDNVLKTEMDTGPLKKRRRTTKRRDTIAGTILLKNTTDYSTFINWITSTLVDSVNPFYFNDPALGNQMTVTFLSTPAISHVGFETYSVAMRMEVLDE